MCGGVPAGNGDGGQCVDRVRQLPSGLRAAIDGPVLLLRLWAGRWLASTLGARRFIRAPRACVLQGSAIGTQGQLVCTQCDAGYFANDTALTACLVGGAAGARA